ncbi:hypothetical protein PITCH_A770002 [uncultured Desulfobacterium sp.]|uniref:Uncharacterized protein n=1 Tax=uncultured Desulfobacterium sp. TaxID=201089 RepID=A0A445N2D7_9BACT|nr:hypothetical protein PITCH_A770002 [uncultured Desulfobacterium sp.]
MSCYCGLYFCRLFIKTVSVTTQVDRLKIEGLSQKIVSVCMGRSAKMKESEITDNIYFCLRNSHGKR